MQRYDAEIDYPMTEEGRPFVKFVADPIDGDWVRYEDAAEREKKARREALEDAAIRLLDSIDSIASKRDRQVVHGCISALRQMAREEEG